MAASTPNLNILIFDSHSPLYVAIADVSIYPENFTIVTPSMEVTAPNFFPITMGVTAGGLSVFNSNDLKITCGSGDCDLQALPDGIWEATYTIAPATTYWDTKKWLRVDNIKKRLQTAFLKTDLRECDSNIKQQDKEILDEISFFIEGAVATANDCNYVRAMQLYKEASKMLNNFNKTKS